MRSAWKAGWLIVGCLLLALPAGSAQKKSTAANSAESVRANLAAKAHVLESRGRPDMAAQLWQQILLSAPGNVEALVGLAKDYQLMGATDLAEQTLDRLRRINPNDPNIAKIRAMQSSTAASGQLRQAGELARQGRNDEAMRIYRQIYGDHPPEGEIALAYYKTLYGATGGKQAAIEGLRNLVASHPGEPGYAVQLGILLTYDQSTRAEGIRMLKAHASDPDAQAQLRTALLWNSANPATAAELREYLKAHPQDTEVQTQLKHNEAMLAQMNSGIARTPQERAAFAALNAHRIDEAEKLFTALLANDPGNGRVAAGMGFLRMQQKNFAEAIHDLTQAEEDGYKDKTVAAALDNSRFWLTMDEAAQALDANQINVAAEKLRAALDMNPRSTDALNGLAGLYIKEQQYPAAASVYEQMLHVQPALMEGWRGLFLAYARDNQFDKALAVAARFPAAVRGALNKDLEYLHALASIDLAQGKTAEAERVLAQALALPLPDKGTALETGVKLEYAGLLMEARHYDQALALYTQILAADANNIPAWVGLVSVQHEAGQDTEAMASVEKIPSATYEAALDDPGFLALLGAIYQQAHQYELAQGFLERAEKQEIAAGGQPSIKIQLQLAAIDLLRNNTDQAYAIYNQVLASYPDRADAWKGMIATLAATKRNQQAIEELAQIPAAPRKQLEGDIDFVQTEASLYAATGDLGRAMQLMNRVDAYYAKTKTQPPAKIAIQSAWLLYNTGNDRALYPALMRLGGRGDLTLAEREQVQDLWANWSVRRAAAAMDNGNAQRAIDILDAAAQAFPNNLEVRKAVAGGYASVGRAKEAVALFKTVPMQDASAGDFEGAVSAALAANDKTQAEIWLRQALERFPADPAVLTLAARFEQARGDNERAAEYYRASLAVMPKVSPVDRLAHVMVYPDQSAKAHRAVTGADLQRLLDPENEPFAKTTKLPPLPSYGPDPYNGNAPVVLPHTQTAPTSPGGNEKQNAPVPNAALQVRRPAGAAHLVLASWPRSRPAWGGRNAVLRSAPVPRAELQAVTATEIVPNPPHSLASDTWKGLVFSLMSAHRNAEALAELARIPADVRRQLEADVEWVQGIAGLYFAVGDLPRATLYLKRVENFDLLHRMAAPAPLEMQRAWLFYNMNDDVALYPLLQRLDERADLLAGQRQQLETLWASWAVRRATQAMTGGHLLRGVQILQAASQDYPDNLSIRFAVAGAYARVGRAQEALTLYKATPMNEAGVGDFQGAISAAIAATDLAQAESWLRGAISRYPNDPVILGLAARFEQARGNNERASEYWRAALATMPAGSGVKSLDYGLVAPPGAYTAPGPGETKRLLDPRLDPQPTVEKLAPLPAYKRQLPAASAPVAATGTTPSALTAPITAPSADPLPMSGEMRNAEPVLVEQSARQRTHTSPAQGEFTGRVHLPPAEENVTSTNADNEAAMQPTLRLSARPMSAGAAEAQAGFAAQTDSQLTAGAMPAVHNLSNAPVTPAPAAQAQPGGASNTTLAQYTPSAQDAATGAYSAPQQQQAEPRQPAKQAKPKAGSTRAGARKARKQTTQRSNEAQKPSAPLPAPAPPQPEETPAEPAPAAQETTTGLTDDELQQRNLPPLRGPWIRLQRQANPPSPREQAEMQLQAIESSYSAWLGGSATLNYRTGDPGYSQMADIEAPFEASAALGYHARITVIAKPVFLDSGQADGNATISVIESTTAGSKLTSIPEPIGTLTATATTIPAQQNAVGLGGELQIAFPHLTIAGGYTPANFLVATFTGRFQWRPSNGPLTVSFVRDAVKDSQLSYAGLRDPAGDKLGTLGQIWGGVVANQGQVQIARGDAQSGYYFSAGGQYITGYHVENNRRIDGNGGAYWRAYTSPELGNLSVGANFFAMHYANNQNAFTHGMGGYFSPQGYFLANVPVTWAGHYETHWHYNIMGALGVQAFQEDATALWPLAEDKALETSQGSPMLANVTSVSGNYDLRAQAAYQIGPHWFAGGYLAANNSRNYSNVSIGFFVRFMFREQPSTATAPTGLFPVDGPRPFTVP